MSLWICPEHGLYGGDIFCPACGGSGEYATFADALNKPTTYVDDPFSPRDSRSKREAPRRETGSARKGESGGGEANRTDNAGTIP